MFAALTALGALGLAGSGPFVATLLVARTGLVPAARWLGLCAAAWLVCGAAAWAISLGSEPRARLARALSALSPLAALLPALSVFYGDDAGYHLARSGAAPVWLLGYAMALLVAGLGWSLLASGAARFGQPTDREANGPAADGEMGTGVAAPVLAPALAALVAPAAGVALMLGLNDLLFGPMGQAGARLDVLALNAVCAGVAGWLAAGTAGGAALGLIVMAVGPAGDRLSTQVIWLAPLLGAAALAATRTGRLLPGGALWGAVASLCPSAVWALPLLAAAGHWGPAALGGTVAAVGLGVPYLSQALAAAAPLSRIVEDETALLENAALSGFFARIFTGAGGLTAPAPVAGPAAALTLGALGVGAALTLSAARRGRDRSALAGAAVAPCLGVVAGLLLGGYTPVEWLPLAALALAMPAQPGWWRALPDGPRRLVAVALVVGFTLVSTTGVAYARAAAELLSAWPALATAPAAGLVLLSAALAAPLAIGPASPAAPPARDAVTPP
jgi:hypothetical protein